MLHSLRVVLKEISLQRSTASDPSSTVDRRRAAGGGSVLNAHCSGEPVGGDQTLEGFQMADCYQTAGGLLRRARFG